MNTALIRKVYAMHKIKKKKYRYHKQPKDNDPAKQKQLLTTMKQMLTKATKAGYRLVYIDETCFTRKTMVDTEYALPTQNVDIDTARLEEPTLALLNAISKENGQEHYMVFKRSVNVPKFKQYLDALRAANGDDKICLFMDNLSAHTSDKAKKHMK